MPAELNCPYCGHGLTPSEVGRLFGMLGKTQNKGRHWAGKLSSKDVNLVRRSKVPTRELAEKYNVSFLTIWRIRKNLTYPSQWSLDCPHCTHGIKPDEIISLFAKLGGSNTSPKKKLATIAGGRARSKLTWKDVEYIRKSSETSSDLARKYGVHYDAIWRIRNFKTWKKP